MSELPKSWARATLGEVATIIRGVTYKKDDAASEPKTGFVPLLRATNISQTLAFENLVYVPSRYVSDIQWLQAGDAVIAASSGSLSVVGKSASLDSEWRGSFGAFCSVARPNRSILARFIGYQLQTPEYRTYVSSRAAGVNINNLKSDDLASFGLSIAPRFEQDRIVAEIDKQFTRLDAAKVVLKRVQANLKRYRASVLKAACEGRLVPTEAELARKEGRDYEPASELLKRILRERRARWEADTLAKLTTSGKPPKDDRWKQKYKKPSAADTTNLPELPEGWCWATISQVAECLDGQRIPINKVERARQGGNVPYYGANGQVGWIDDYLFDEPLVLVVEDETFVGRQIPFSYLITGKSWVNNHAHVLKATPAVITEFLNYSLAYYPFTQLTTGSTGRRKTYPKGAHGSSVPTAPFGRAVQNRSRGRAQAFR